MNDPIIIRTFTNRGEAEIARSLLESDGVTAAVSDEERGGLTPSLDFSSGVQLVVEAVDVDRARALLDEIVSADELDAAERASEDPEI